MTAALTKPITFRFSPLQKALEGYDLVYDSGRLRVHYYVDKYVAAHHDLERFQQEIGSPTGKREVCKWASRNNILKLSNEEKGRNRSFFHKKNQGGTYLFDVNQICEYLIQRNVLGLTDPGKQLRVYPDPGNQFCVYPNPVAMLPSTGALPPFPTPQQALTALGTPTWGAGAADAAAPTATHPHLQDWQGSSPYLNPMDHFTQPYPVATSIPIGYSSDEDTWRLFPGSGLELEDFPSPELPF